MTGAAVAVAAALGAVSRFLVDRAVSARGARGWPAGTLVVNVTGSLALGVLAGLALQHQVPDGARTVVGTGFIGAYTTFSAFAFETVDLARQGAGERAAGYVVGSLIAGLAVSWLGIAVGVRLS